LILPYRQYPQKLIHIKIAAYFIPLSVVQGNLSLRPKHPKASLQVGRQWLVARAVTSRPKTKNGCALACIKHGKADQVSSACGFGTGQWDRLVEENQWGRQDS
jgi:hypothetical protein